MQNIQMIQQYHMNLKVVQFQGLAPSVFCGMYFADQGAEVILVARAQSAPVSMPINKNILNRNKKCITINLKDKQQFEVVKKLLMNADVLIDPYRPGVLQKLKLGPKQLYEINKKIVLLRVSGYGQTGERALRPGHDLNYLSVGGIIPILNKIGEYQFPSNFMADFVSASLGITGTLAALHQRQKTGIGKVVDCSLANGCAYLAQNIQQTFGQSDSKDIIVRQAKINGKTYIFNSKDNKVFSQKQIKQLICDQEYYCSPDRGIEISLVKEIETLQSCNLVNPFSNIRLSNKIANKGQDNSEILSAIRPKL